MPAGAPIALPDWKKVRFASLLAWTASTNVAAGERVYNGTNVYQCTTGGATGNSGGPTGTGASITDPGGTAVWMYIGLIAPAWQASTGYSQGDRVTANGKVYVCLVPGTSAAPPATGPNSTGNQISDGTNGLIWLYLMQASAQLVEPPDGLKDVGWGVAQYPGAQTLNHFAYWLYRFALYVYDLANQAMTWTAAHVFQAGITVTQSTANGDAITATGNGSGNGITATGGSNGAGVVATANGSHTGVGGTGGPGVGSVGVSGTSFATSGIGVQGIGSQGIQGNGYGDGGIGVVGTGASAASNISTNGGDGVQANGGHGDTLGTGTGNGGNGITATGGAKSTTGVGTTDGNGGVFTGGGTNSIGVKGTGQGSGAGVVGQGGSSAGTGGNGVEGTGGTFNGNGVLGTGNGTYGVGVVGLYAGASAPSSVSAGVAGIGSSAAVGVYGEAAGSKPAISGNATGSGPGVEGASSSGPGGSFSGNTTRGAINLGVSTKPATGVAGDIVWDGTDFWFCTASGTPGTWYKVGP